MKQRHVAWLTLSIGVMMIVVTALIGCSSDTSAPELAAPADNTTITDDTTTSEDVVTVAMDAQQTTFEDQECIDCHTDDVLLMELATEDEPVESHSEGPG